MNIPFISALVEVAELNELLRAHWRKTTEKDVTNTTTATDLLNGEVTIEAGAIESLRELRVRLFGDLLNNTGGNVIPTIAVKLGGATIFSGTPTIGTNASRRHWEIDVTIANSAAAVQAVEALLIVGANDATWTNTGVRYIATVASAVDTSVACLLEVTVQWPSATTGLSWRLKRATVEVA